MDRDGIKGHLDLVLLGVLADGPRHGYGVITALRTRSEGVIDLQEGSVYPALHRLQDAGWLDSEWQPVGGRRRRVYRLTAQGAQALERRRRDWRRLAYAIEGVIRPTAVVGGAA